MWHTAWSYDAGETWADLSVSEMLYDGGGMRRGQGTLAAGRPGTPSEGWIYVLYEGSEHHRYDGANLARFNLSWVLEGERTGDGVIPPEYVSHR